MCPMANVSCLPIEHVHYHITHYRMHTALQGHFMARFRGLTFGCEIDDLDLAVINKASHP